MDLGLSTVSFSPPPPLDSFVAVATVTAVPRDPSTVSTCRNSSCLVDVLDVSEGDHSTRNEQD